MIAKKYDINLKRKQIELVLLTTNKKKKMRRKATKLILQKLHQREVILALFKGRER